ncbi:hypothetical protein DVS28_b0516 (plasmid) [Euzebya pacifica]|uniref:Uncharacterized protein n=1 Tax=Euzebya pacifica TaxID=1608957 RepID=A0A346Y709_9ACTN|nr:hypothetical protein [Euzebya pacifica]AXV10256.1 hypothetical protein DVS28_b0516 [Euzebya pacifica]
MLTVAYFTLSATEEDLASLAFTGLHDRLFPASRPDATADLAWLVNGTNRAPVTADRAARIRMTLYEAIKILREQADADYWRTGATAITDSAANAGLFAESTAANRQRALRAAEELLDLMGTSSPPTVVAQLEDPRALADRYYAGEEPWEIAEDLGVGTWEVTDAMRRQGIRSRKHLLSDHDWVTEAVHRDGVDAVADRIGTTPQRVRAAANGPAAG